MIDAVGASWLATHVAMRQSATGLARRRTRLWRSLAPALERTPALADSVGRPLSHFRVTDAAALRADYGAWNSLGCTHDEIHAAAQDAETGGAGELRPGVCAGYSTGSAGARGVFLASAAERADYIGQALARLVPLRMLARPMRIALILRANSRLYSDTDRGDRKFLYLPLDLDLAQTCERLRAFSPTILIAPASRLASLADAAAAGRFSLPALTRLYYGAEPMGRAERSWIAEVFGHRPDPIYQATEGFIGAACPHGALHLNEHSFVVELEPVAGVCGYRPIVTDLRRTSQPIVRVRTDDYLELDPAGCRCGYAGRVIRPLMGRVGDVWRFGDTAISPSQVSETMETLLGPVGEWQAIARADHVRLRVGGAPASPPRSDVAREFARRLRLAVPVVLDETPPDAPKPKRRRVLVADGGHG